MECNKEMDWLWLSMIPGLYRLDKKKLLDIYRTPSLIRSADSKEIQGLFCLKDIQKKNLLEWQKKKEEEFLPILKQNDIAFYSYEHPLFPQRLLELSDHPYGIFVRGKLPEKYARCIAIVGARSCTNYGRKMAQSIASELVKHGIIVVSGMALGIDGIAQAAALEQGGMSIAVVGSGCDICYPRSHIELFEQLKRNGAVISEYPPGTIPHSSHFPQRNRIISGMSEAVIVIEAQEKSGSLITADMALEQGRDVYAVPGRIGDTLSIGTNSLISQGAGIILSKEFLLKELGLEDKTTKKEKKQNNNLAICENMVYICLDFHGKSLEELMECTKYSGEEVMGALFQLQIKGLAVEISKNRYALA